MISLEVNRQQFIIALSSQDAEYLSNKALEFCIEHMATLKIPPQTLETACRKPVYQHLLQVVPTEEAVFFDAKPPSEQGQQLKFPPGQSPCPLPQFDPAVSIG